MLSEEEACLLAMTVIVRTPIIVALLVEAVVFDRWVEIRVIRVAI